MAKSVTKQILHHEESKIEEVLKINTAEAEDDNHKSASGCLDLRKPEFKVIIGKERQKGYCAMSRGHSCVLGMKTQCMRTKSSTAGSDRGGENNRKEGGGRGVVGFQENRALNRALCPECAQYTLRSSGTWFTGMDVYSHGLQEVLKNLLWRA